MGKSRADAASKITFFSLKTTSLSAISTQMTISLDQGELENSLRYVTKDIENGYFLFT